MSNTEITSGSISPDSLVLERPSEDAPEGHHAP